MDSTNDQDDPTLDAEGEPEPIPVSPLVYQHISKVLGQHYETVNLYAVSDIARYIAVLTGYQAPNAAPASELYTKEQVYQAALQKIAGKKKHSGKVDPLSYDELSLTAAQHDEFISMARAAIEQAESLPEITRLEDYDLEGYVPGYPRARAGFELMDGPSIDAQVCREVACHICGNKPNQYHPYRKPDGSSYRAFSVCPKCGNAVEF